MRHGTTSAAVGVLTACIVVPPVGAWLAGRPVEPLLRFPPLLAIPVEYPRFSWIACALIAGAALAVAQPWIKRRRALLPARREIEPHHPPNVGPSSSARPRFAWWGWLAIAWTLAWWWLAWTREPWFAWAQRYTFAPLWLGFILTVNALACQRGGTCLMRRAPGKWLALFVASAAFWWVFEWLNRFVRNWHYLAVKDVGALEYAVHATVCFSTVLPAVTGMRELLGTLPRFESWLGAGPRWSWMSWRPAGAILVVAGIAGLGLTGAQPLYFYPAVWAAPLLIGVGWCGLGRIRGWWPEIVLGDWRNVGCWAFAAVICGFFWELWNVYSLAKWVYTVPFVQRWQVFEMPLLGYTGYLPFGLECGLVAAWVLGRKETVDEGDWQNRADGMHIPTHTRGP